MRAGSTSSVFTSVLLHITQSVAHSRGSVNIGSFMIVTDVLLLVGLHDYFKEKAESRSAPHLCLRHRSTQTLPDVGA